MRGVKAYLAADNADLEEVGVLRGVLLVNLTGEFTESITENTEVLGRSEHQAASITLGDLDITLEDIVVAEAQLQRGNSHSLGDSTEVEDTLLPEAGEVEETLFTMFQSVKDHLGVAVQGGLLILRLEEILEVIHMLGPDLLGPEATVIIKVLSDIADDVGLLQE